MKSKGGKFLQWGVVLGVVNSFGCGVVSQKDICLVDPSVCPANPNQVTQYTIAALTLSGAQDFGSIEQGSSKAATVTVTNIGSVAGTLGTITAAGLGLSEPYTVTGGTRATGAAIAPSGTCTIALTFAPSTASTFSQTLTLGYNNSVSNQTVTTSVTGIGTGTTIPGDAVLTISDGATYNFGSVNQGNSGVKTFTVSNASGVVSATLGTVTTAGLGLSGVFSLTGGTCTTGATLAASGTCTLIVTFTADNSGALASQTISLGYNNGSEDTTATRAIQGTSVVTDAVLAIAPATTNAFGNVIVGASPGDLTFVVTNNGLSSASYSAPTTANIGLSGQYTLNSTTCGTSLAASATCNLVVRFRPTGAGADNKTITLTHNNGSSGGHTVTQAVTGTGITAATLTITADTSSDFGSVITNSGNEERTFTVTNSGATAATYTSFETNNGLSGQYTVQSTDCGTSLAASSTCSMVVQFAPTVDGDDHQTITLIYNNGVAGGQSATRAITGNGNCMCYSFDFSSDEINASRAV